MWVYEARSTVTDQSASLKTFAILNPTTFEKVFEMSQNFDRNVGNFGVFTIILVLLVLLTFGILQGLHIPTGNFVDWIVGTASFWWLILIVTVPWNIHFGAKAVLAQAAESKQKNITVDDRQVQYVAKLARRSFWAAFFLHLISAVGLYALATTGISAIGYVSSGAALLFTAVRPTIAFYQYLAGRLRNIGREFYYPREDIVELRSRVINLEEIARRLDYQLDGDKPDSFATNLQRESDSLRRDLSRLATAHEDLKATNQAEHDRLSREAKNAIAQLSEDSRFLDNVREIIRFFKTA